MTTDEWVSHLTNPEAVTTLFESLPSLDWVGVTEISLEARGEVRLWIDLDAYPEDPPQRWEGNDRVNVELALWGVTGRCIQSTGFLMELEGELSIRGHGEEIEVSLDSDTDDSACRFICEEIYLERYTPYVAGANDC